MLTAGALGLIATVIAAVLPVLVSAWQTELKFSAHEAGYVAATELFAQVCGTVLFLCLDRVWPLRRCAGLGLALMVAGNLTSAESQHLAALVASRMIAGTGGGIVRALSMKCLARAVNPGRAFAMYASGQVAIAATVSAVIPQILNIVGLRVPFMLLAGLCAAAVGLTFLLPTGPLSRPYPSQRLHVPAQSIWTLGALFIFFIGQAGVWTFLAPLGEAQHVAPRAISGTLVWLNVAGLVGTLGAAALADRVSPLGTITCLLGITLLAILGLFHSHFSWLLFALSACSFYFAWCASLPFQFAIIARSDETGGAGAAAPAIDGLGLACGAAMAGVLITRIGVSAAGLLCVVGSLGGVACYVFANSLIRKTSRSTSLQASSAG